MSHPSSHLWPALQRRFADQNKPSTAPDRLLRAFCVVPLEGQEASTSFNLGFKEAGSALRSVSLSRDFMAVANLVSPDEPCYLIVYVGDVAAPRRPGSDAATALEAPRDWALVTYVPSSCSGGVAKKIADNRAALKTGLGDDRFTEGGMWCVNVEQISLSGYMRSAEAAASGSPGRVELEPLAPAFAGAGFDTSMPSSSMVAPQPSDEAMLAATVGTGGPADTMLGVSVGFDETGTPLDATEAIWEERIKGVRHAYTDSCSRLVGALEELEQTLCNLTGDPYRADEPLLRARSHLSKDLELLQQPA